MSIATRAALAVATAMALSGCNMVMTDKPMFAAADGAGAPPLHPGVWRSEKQGCDFDESQSEDQWPLCSDAPPSVGDSPFWQEVAGAPIILQTPLALPGAKDSDVKYFYVAVHPLKVDAGGRVVAMKSWLVRCGSPPPPAAATFPPPAAAPQKPDSMTNAEWADRQTKLAKLRTDSEKLQAALNQAAPTKHPLPGMKMDGGSSICTPDSVASLRSAAKASEAWADDDAVSHWVRERGKGDKPPATPASLFNMAGGQLLPVPLGPTVFKNAVTPGFGTVRTDQGTD